MIDMTHPKAWEVLQVAPGASEDQIRAAYRARAKELHPDAGGDRARWDELEAAYMRLMVDASHGVDEAYDQPARKTYWKWRGMPRVPRVLVLFVIGGALLAGGGWAFVSWAAAGGVPWEIPAVTMTYPAMAWVWLMVSEAKRPAVQQVRWYLLRVPTDDADLERLITVLRDQEKPKPK